MNEVLGGAVFRMIVDFNNQDGIDFIADVGCELTNPFKKETRLGMNKIWN